MFRSDRLVFGQSISRFAILLRIWLVGRLSHFVYLGLIPDKRDTPSAALSIAYSLALVPTSLFIMNRNPLFPSYSSSVRVQRKMVIFSGAFPLSSEEGAPIC